MVNEQVHKAKVNFPNVIREHRIDKNRRVYYFKCVFSSSLNATYIKDALRKHLSALKHSGIRIGIAFSVQSNVFRRMYKATWMRWAR